MDLDADACYRAFRTRDARFDGRIFAGVLTTGIYCRPICPARTPKRENVTFYPSAAAAREAGFRPCLRCRPETSPEGAAWHGSSTTVARALALIESGALDEGDVESLAERLGIGGRHLRRLFETHLGASPLAVAQTRRIHLGTQLVRDTTLPMAEVALASGFGSVRRFNETFRRLFGRPPASLRRASRSTPGRAGAITITLPYVMPYDFHALLGFLEARAIPGVESVKGGCYARTIASGSAHGTLRVEADRPGRLRLTVELPAVTELPGVIARVRRLFDLAADPIAIGAHLAEDPLLRPLVARRQGLRVPGAWDGFELAVRAVLGQQITVGAATRLVGRLADLCGERVVTADPALSRVFPTPGAVARADLGRLGVPRARARTITALAKAVAEDSALLAPGRGLSDAVERLRAIPGVGEWTAQYVAMRELREPDAFPAADAGILRALARLDGERGRAPTAATALARAKAWRPWRAYAAVHLWASLADAAPESTILKEEKNNGRRVA